MFSIPYEIRKTNLLSAFDVAYIDEGKGEWTILFIHGLASYGLSWQKNIESLKNNFRCIAMDLPGNGFSGRGDYPYSIHFFSTIVKEFIDSLDLDHLCIAGHSMGGQIALRTLIDHPSCASKMVLCAPAGFETFTPFELGLYQASFHFFDFFSSEENSLKKSIRSSFYSYNAQAEDMISNLVNILQHYPVKEYRKMIEQCIHGMLYEPVFEKLADIEQETLVIFGERDAMIPNRLIHPVNTRNIAEAGVRQMPHATLEMLGQCGHFVQWERAGDVNELITAFLKQ